MSRIILFFVLILVKVISVSAQTIPSERTVDWTLAGIRDTSTTNFTLINVLENGFNNDGSVANDNALLALFSAHSEPVIVYFPAGIYLFNSTIVLRSDVVLRGAGAPLTFLKLDLGGSGHGILGQGTTVLNDTSSIHPVLKNDTKIRVNNSTLFNAGDWVRFIQQDSDLVYSSWGLNTVGQIVGINAIQGDSLFLDSPIRMDYPVSRLPLIRKMIPLRNIGIECLTIQRMDYTAPEQASNICFINVVNSWVNGIESVNTTFAHIEANACSNISLTNSFLHDSFDYGGGGRGYGVMFHFTSNECLVYNNIFKHLRHSMILQAGANANVFAYNRSIEPYWTGSGLVPSDAAGDMVLHGNYPYANLFEQNDGQNMVIDNSHGTNGPYNTFFRNRGSLFGLFFSDATSPNQNLVGNEITNGNFPYSSINYSIQGTGHFIYGNNNKGAITPTGTSNLPDSTYCFQYRPTEIPWSFWSSIGPPNSLGSGSIPAAYNYNQGDYFSSACGGTTSLSVNETEDQQSEIVYPNPVDQFIYVAGITNAKYQIYNSDGRLVAQGSTEGFIGIGDLARGSYILKLDSLPSNRIIRFQKVN